MMSEALQIFCEVLYGLVMLVVYMIEGLVRAIWPGPLFPKDVKGEKVLITGAGSGLGRLMAVRFAELGCILVLWDVNTDGLKETASQVEKTGSKAFIYTVDLCDREKVYEVANKVKKEVGEINILVNNAGIVTGKKLLECPDNMIQKTMDVNIMAHFWTVKAFLPAMLKANHGHIVTIASAAGYSGTSGLVDYCASKYAAVGFDESLRNELYATGKTGVKTTVVCPIWISTGMFTGVKTRFDLMTPMLKPEYAVMKIVNAVLTNQALLMLPRAIYFATALKGLLPIKTQLQMSKFMGVASAMEGFVGREKKD